MTDSSLVIALRIGLPVRDQRARMRIHRFAICGGVLERFRPVVFVISHEPPASNPLALHRRGTRASSLQPWSPSHGTQARM
jgi:hypothetical protein